MKDPTVPHPSGPCCSCEDWSEAGCCVPELRHMDARTLPPGHYAVHRPGRREPEHVRVARRPGQSEPHVWGLSTWLDDEDGPVDYRTLGQPASQYVADLPPGTTIKVDHDQTHDGGAALAQVARDDRARRMKTDHRKWLIWAPTRERAFALAREAGVDPYRAKIVTAGSADRSLLGLDPRRYRLLGITNRGVALLQGYPADRWDAPTPPP